MGKWLLRHNTGIIDQELRREVIGSINDEIVILDQIHDLQRKYGNTTQLMLENLEKKKAIIEKQTAIDETTDVEEATQQVRELMKEWNGIGHVPFKEKDKIYKEYHEAVDKQFDRLKVDQNDRKMQTFRNSLSDMSNGERGKGKLYGEREKLMRMYERMKNELQTYENNIGFLSISSKGGGGLLKEMERKIDKLKDEMALIIKKIDAIDENLE